MVSLPAKGRTHTPAFHRRLNFIHAVDGLRPHQRTTSKYSAGIVEGLLNLYHSATRVGEWVREEGAYILTGAVEYFAAFP